LNAQRERHSHEGPLRYAVAAMILMAAFVPFGRAALR
jgi:hypothetical protein